MRLCGRYINREWSKWCINRAELPGNKELNGEDGAS